VKLRENGIYRFKGREYIAVSLESDGESWGVTGLVYWPVGSQVPRDIIYLRHATGEVIGVKDFQSVGTLADLEDTGRDDARQGVLVEDRRG
jgi:hypothetical protein